MIQKTGGTIILALLFIVLPGCVSPNAVKTEIQGIRIDMGQLEKIVEQKADNIVVAKQVDQVNNKIEQITQVAENLSVWRKDIEAGVINYSGGGGWIVTGIGMVVLIFVGAGFLLIKAFMKRGTLLALLTCAIQKAGIQSPIIGNTIKQQLKKEVAEGKFKEVDRQNIGHFARKVGTFLEQMD